MHARLINTLEGLEELAPAWRRLYDMIPENAVLFSSWEFVHAYVSFQAPTNWVVIALFPDPQSTQPLAIFPLELYGGPVEGVEARIGRFLGTSFAYYNDYLIEPDHRAEALDALMKLARTQLNCDALQFGLVHEDSRNYLLLMELGAPSDYVIQRFRTAPYIDTRSIDPDRLFQGKKKSTLADTLRCARRLAELGTVTFSVSRPDAQDVEVLLQRHADKFAGRHHFDAIDANWRDFYIRLATTEAYASVVEFSTLELSGEVISAHLGYVGKGRKVYGFYAHDRKFDRYSPSKVHMHHLIRRAFDERAIFCFGPGLFPYKKDWSQTTAELKKMWLFLTPRARSTLGERVRNKLDLFDQQA